LRQSKARRGKGRRVTIPVGSPLKDVLDTALKEKKRSAVTILTNSRGAPWTEDGFRTSWDKAFRKTSLKDLHFHDLRGTAVKLLGAGDRLDYRTLDDNGAGDPRRALPWRPRRACGVSYQEAKRGVRTGAEMSFGDIADSR
jgi:integrase